MQANWQKDFFRGVALEMWRRAITPEQTRAEVDFLEKRIYGGTAGKFLDVPCGNGRHAVELAMRGHAVTAVDSSEESIAEARTKSGPVEWLLGDMCELPRIAKFDVAYCFGNSFGYLDRDGVRRFLRAIARALKPAGRFVIETGMAAESILPGLVKNRWFRLGDIFMLSENQYDPEQGRLDIQYTFIRGGEVSVRPSSSFTFTVAEIYRLHEEADLEIIEMLGSINGEAYQLGSPRLILTSQRRH
jgi:SAM-dependent methyltransferase